MRSSKTFWVLMASWSLIAFTGHASLLMASSAQSHATHFVSDKGPHMLLNEIGCYECHADGRLQCQGPPILFADSTIVDGVVVVPQSLETTSVCDTCHSPGGAFDGVGDLDPDNSKSVAFGAKYNWASGVYASDGVTLKSGKEKWCAGCHDGQVGESDSYADINRVIPDWQTDTPYHVGDIVKHNNKGWKCITYHISDGSPILAYWVSIDWQSGTQYQVGDIVKYDGDAWQCIADHTSEGSPSQDDWVLTDWRVLAPGVIGDNSSYGFYYSGHGQWPSNEVHCDGCHDCTYEHIDGKQRTYVSTSDNYQEAYRLKADMAIPRHDVDVDTAFTLCMDVCHLPHADVLSDVTEYKTNFRDYWEGEQYHYSHLQNTPVLAADWYDSDFDSNTGSIRGLDSGMSCPACHNPHGSDTPVMIRNGQLISPPGTPAQSALGFHWYEDKDMTIETFDLEDSRYGWMDMGVNATDNHVCDHCHVSLTENYYRVPGGIPQILHVVIWVTDENDNVPDSFAPNDPIKFHMTFSIHGDEETTYFLQTVESGAYDAVPPTDWQIPVNMQSNVAPGTHTVSTVKTIPLNATTGSAKYRMELRMDRGELLPDTNNKIITFQIEE